MDREAKAYVKRIGKTDILYTRFPPKDAIPLFSQNSGRKKDPNNEEEVR